MDSVPAGRRTLARILAKTFYDWTYCRRGIHHWAPRSVANHEPYRTPAELGQMFAAQFEADTIIIGYTTHWYCLTCGAVSTKKNPSA